MPIYYDENSGSDYQAVVAGEPGEGPYKVIATPTENACIQYYEQDELVYGEPGEAVEVDCTVKSGRVTCAIEVTCADEDVSDEMFVTAGVVSGYEDFGIQSVVATPSIPQLSAKFPVSALLGGVIDMSLDALAPNTTYSITITPTANAIAHQDSTAGQPTTTEFTTDEEGAAQLSMGAVLATDMSIGGALNITFGNGGGGGPK